VVDTTGSPPRRLLEDRVRILAVISQALEKRDAVLRLVGESEDRDRAREALMAEYDWDHVGATAVLDLRLQHVTRGDRQRIAEELNEIRERLKTLPRQGG
jgi:DNA gyrase subunit A